MKRLTAAFLAAGVAVAVAQDDPFVKGDDLLAKCSEGCVVFTRQEAAQFEQQINQILENRQKEAFQAGVKYQAQACRSLL